MKFKNTNTYTVYDKNGKIYKNQENITDENLVVTQGKEVIRDCLIYENKSTQGVIAYWKLDDNTPTTNVIDETNNYNGTCSVNTNTIYSSEGRDGGCQDKANTVYTEVGSATDFLYQEFSISLWVKFDSVSGTPTLFGGQDVGNWQDGYAMRLTGGVFKFHTNHWSSGQVLTSTTTPIVDTWYHCTFVVNDNGTNRMYINGIEEASASYSIIAHSGQTKIIGNSTDRDAGHGLDGKIDNVHFMNKALSQSEITVLYNNYDFRFNGLRNIKLSTNATGPQLTDTSIGGTEYSCRRQSNESETNLEDDISFGSTTLEHDTLTIPFKYTNDTGGELTLNKLGAFDYNGGSQRLFSALLLNSGNGATIPDGGYILSYYEMILEKGVNDDGYLTDWGIKAIIHALVYGNTDYNIDYVGFGSGKNHILPMTNDTSPSPFVASSSSTWQSNLTSYRAFDGGSGVWQPRNNAEPHWVQIDCGSVVSVGAYLIKGTSSNAIRDWTIQGSNTGVFSGEETILDTQSGNTDTDDNAIVIAFNGIQSFRYWRVHLTYGVTGYTNVEMFQLLRYEADNSINNLFATTQATSILPSESNKLLTSFDYTDSGGHQVEEVGVGHKLDITSSATMTHNNVTNIENITDDNLSTKANIGNTKYISYYDDTYSHIEIKAQYHYTNADKLHIHTSNNTTDGVNGDWDLFGDFTINNSDTFLTSYSLQGVKGVRITGSQANFYIHEVKVYSLNLFSKFAHSKTLSDSENWISSISNNIEF